MKKKYRIEIIDESDYKEKAKELAINGVTVIPILYYEERKKYRRMFYEVLKNFPEYISNVEIYVQGAFGALGNPASFHNPCVRMLRKRVMLDAVKLFSAYDSNKFLQQLPDRMSIRRVGTTIGKEKFHRDITDRKLLHKDDIIFGGWLNLDLWESQYFSCVLGTHNDKLDHKKGFVTLPAKEYEDKKTLIEIPPGHLIIFPQHIVHEVLSRKIKKESIRLYMGWRLTSSPAESLFDYSKIAKEQGCFPLPSGQKPPMYSPNHVSFYKDKLIEWSGDTFQSECIVNNIVDRYMKSLKQYNFTMYEPYSEDELSLLVPNKQWKITLNDKIYLINI